MNDENSSEPDQELENVEENINAYEIEEDLRITEDMERDENNLLALTQEKTAELLENIGPKKKNTILHQYQSRLPQNVNNALEYHYYNISYNYFLVTAENGSIIREQPDAASANVGRVEYLDKVSLLQRVEGEYASGSSIWYRIAIAKNNQVYEGYLHSSAGFPRVFRFYTMADAVNSLKQNLEKGELHYVSNYRNQNGTPPGMGSISVDQYGYRVYHSAPAYVAASTDVDFRYVPDGMLVRILGESGNFYHVNIPAFGGNYFIPRQYIDTKNKLTRLEHVVVVDNEQQNQAAFEITENGLNLISYTLATTGMPGEYTFETSPGSYKALQKRDRFEYLHKESNDIAGYAPFATRFSGGAYIHGVPVSYREQNGKKIDPGLVEYIQTIGTFPRSSMCVRNFTSHADFIYNWMNIRNGAVIVIG